MIVSSAELKKEIDKIITIKRDNTFKLEIELYSKTNKDFFIDFKTIDSLTIEQDFFNNFTDEITLNLNVSPKDYVTIMNNPNNLLISIKIVYLKDNTIEINEDEEVEIYNYNVFIKNMEDLSKRYNLQEFIDTEFDTTRVQTKAEMLIPLELQLIDDYSYSIKKKSAVGMFTNCTIEKVIKYLAASMGIKKINLIPPDNEVEYVNLYIPPEYSKINVVFTYLQQRYGIYEHGLNYYFTNGVLYVYPEFDTDSKRKQQLKLIRTTPNAYSGGINYFDEDSNSITIVSTGEVLQRSFHNATTENEGNSIIFLVADKLIDKTVTIKNDKVHIEDIALICNNKNDLSVIEGSTVPKYIKPVTNAINVISDINNKSLESIIVGWSLARPFKLIPGQRVVLITDGLDGINYTNGILYSVNYMCKKESAYADFNPFHFYCSMMIRLSPFTNKI